MLRIARKYKYTVMCIEQSQHYGLWLSHTRPSVLVLYDVGFNVILNTRINYYTRQFSWTDQSGSQSGLITQYPIARTWESAPK